MTRFLFIKLVRATMTDITERTTTGTNITHNHKGRGTISEALRQIRTSRFFTNGVELLLTQRGFDACHFRRRRHLNPNPIRLFLSLNGWNDLNRDTRHFIVATQFFALDGFFWFCFSSRYMVLYGSSHNQMFS